MFKVLIVDDEKIVRIALKTMIQWEEHGFQLIGGAIDGSSALDMAEKLRPDIIITDLKMPVMDGLELIGKLQERLYPGKIIVLSNYGDYDHVRKAMKLGALDYLLKMTLKPEELLDLLHKASKQIITDKEQIAQDIRINFALNENNLLLKKQFFKDLLLEDDSAVQHVRSQSKKLGIEAGSELSYLICISIEPNDPLLGEGKIKDQKLLAYSVVNIVREVLSEAAQLEIAELSYKEFVVLLPVGDEQTFELRKSQILRNIPAILQQYLNLRVDITLSPAFAGLEHMRSAYESAAGLTKCIQMMPLEEKRYRKEVEEVIAYMKAHLGKKLVLSEMAGLVNLNESYLCRLFKSETGQTIVNYLTGLRMQKANELLRDRSVMIKEVAAQVGIDDPFYFNRLFYKQNGQSPSEFRRSIEGSNYHS